MFTYTENEKSTGLDTLDNTTLSNSDLVIVGDVSDSGRAKGITWTSIKAFLKTYFDGLYPSGSGTSTGTNTGDATTTTEGALINGANAKATPVDADFLGLMDSAASNILTKLSWANVKATLKTYFDTLYTSTPAYQQDIPNSTAETLVDNEFAAGSNSDGSVLFFMNQTILYRFARDTASGQYFQTHRIDPTFALTAGDCGSIIVIGSNIYIFGNDGTNVKCTRFLAADLTGEQAMTVPVVANTTSVTAWTNGTDAYLVSEQSATTSRRWTVSGTTFSAASTASVASIVDNNHCTMYDGTSAYVFNQGGGNPSLILKLTSIDGSAKTTTNKTMPVILSDIKTGGFIIPIDTTRAYIGFWYQNWNELNADAKISTNIRLYPISKP